MKDPPHAHPRTVFLPDTQTENWRQFVEEIRPHRNVKKTSTAPDKEDGFEGPIRVPTSVLDACEGSFTAADETRQKASTQFFDSTALMGLLCRHDRVLWLVNMTSAGERQHYALALIDTLFENLPPKYTVGILYDVACSLHRSCVKWNFLDKYQERITFAISVFHAYGHGWACQCIYHPRKCVGFGLSDGEGCERFWHSISKLIAYLRVCGVSPRDELLVSGPDIHYSLSIIVVSILLMPRSSTPTVRVLKDSQFGLSANGGKPRQRKLKPRKCFKNVDTPWTFFNGSGSCRSLLKQNQYHVGTPYAHLTCG
jgi:hypothetical protein